MTHTWRWRRRGHKAWEEERKLIQQAVDYWEVVRHKGLEEEEMYQRKLRALREHNAQEPK